MVDAATTARAVTLVAEVMHDTPITTPSGTGFSVKLSDANQAADVLIALRDHHLDIVNAAIEQPNLDDVFRALTGRSGETSTPETETSNA